MADRGKGFPRLSLSGAVQIMDAASKFGRTWKKEQFATFGVRGGAASVNSGAFTSRLSSLKDYGLIISDKDNVSITDLALSITKPVTTNEREVAIRKAFLSVATFSDLYASFEGGVALSKDKVAEHAVYNLGISRDSKDRFVNNFIDSGEYINLVSFNKDDGTITLVKTETDIAEGEPVANANVAAFVNGLASMPIKTAIKQNIPQAESGMVMSEQGVNHAGNGWTLTVLIKSANRLTPTTRKKVRDLLELADEVADELHGLEDGES
jgi:uncharacterized membrane protein